MVKVMLSGPGARNTELGYTSAYSTVAIEIGTKHIANSAQPDGSNRYVRVYTGEKATGRGKPDKGPRTYSKWGGRRDFLSFTDRIGDARDENPK